MDLFCGRIHRSIEQSNLVLAQISKDMHSTILLALINTFRDDNSMWRNGAISGRQSLAFGPSSAPDSDNRPAVADAGLDDIMVSILMGRFVGSTHISYEKTSILRRIDMGGIRLRH